MVQLAFIIASAAALATGVVGFPDTCTPGQFYCGSQLLNGSGANFELWKDRIDAALAERGLPADGEHEFNSLFFCSTPTTLALDEFCFDQPGNRCQPANSKACAGSNPNNLNDCCGPSI